MAYVRISVADLWTYRVAETGGTEREPLSRLAEGQNSGHVHGTLTIEIAGRTVPHLGFFGPDDVCMNTWVVELCLAANALGEGSGEHTFDEGEQGQPAFTFQRIGEDVSFSINESVLGGGPADPEWQDVRFPYGAFRTAVVAFLDDLREQLRRHAPDGWEPWWPHKARLSPA
ncbi:MAG: hypothetical protein KF795_00690 [Labilithrix sp.]|nr:hypothetical protein [Labilithrix sp.]